MNSQKTETIHVKGKKNLVSSLNLYLNNKNFADVCFIINNERIYAHKLMLASRSPYFSNLILSNCKDNSNLEIEIEDSSSKVFLGVLEYMYTDQVQVSMENIWEIYKAATIYELLDLVTCCNDFLVQRISFENVLFILKTSELNENSLVFEHCYSFLERNVKNFNLKNLEEAEKKIQEMKKEKMNPPKNYFENSSTLSEQTQTLQPWNSNQNGPPPTAFPTPESISAFPSFFKPKTNKKETTVEPKKSTLQRRLSVVSDPSVSGILKIEFLNLGIFLQILISCTTKLLSSERSSLFMYDKNTDELISQVSNGDTTTQLERTEMKDESMRNVICSPILDKENKILGIIEILLQPSKEFTNENESHLRSISALFSIVFEEMEKEKKQIEMNQSGQSTTTNHSLRKRSLFDLNFLSEEDFNLSEILESRSSVDFKLPSEENMDTSFQNLMRSYSIESRNSSLDSLQQYQFGGQSTLIPSSSGSGGGSVPTLNSMIPNQVDSKRDQFNLIQNSRMLKDTSDTDAFLIQQDQYGEMMNQESVVQGNSGGRGNQKLTFVSEEFQIPSNGEEGVTENHKKRKNIDNLPFMHFRIPRYELQFIQFDAEGVKKKKK
jgi:hypothetical protein